VILLACEGVAANTRMAGGIVVALVAAGLLGLFATLVVRAGSERLLVIATYAVTAVTGAVIVLTPGGFADSGGNYLLRAFAAAAAGLTCGLAVAVVRGRRLVTYALIGTLGGGSLIVGGLLLLLGAVWIGGPCFE
jgi:hypothetical protein